MNLPASFSTIPGYGNFFWMDVVAMVAISSLLGSLQSTAVDPIPAESESTELAERFRHESRVMFELADTAVSEEVRREFLKLAAEWLKLASETRKPAM
jgi:hypothetical protein